MESSWSQGELSAITVRVPARSSPGRVRWASSAPTAPRQPWRMRSASRRSPRAGTAAVSIVPTRTGKEERADPIVDP